MRIDSGGIGDMQRRFFALGALYGFLGVALGAFGAHALKSTLSNEAAAIYHTAVEYHLVHALALLFAASRLKAPNASTAAAIAAWGFAMGVPLFSGSLYALALTGWRTLGIVTPFGGLAFLIAWAGLAYDGWRNQAADQVSSGG